MDTMALAMWARQWLLPVIAGIVLGASVYMFWLSPTIHQIFANVADDHCPMASSGEPDRNDQDCHGSWGRNYVEEWDLAHPAP